MRPRGYGKRYTPESPQRGQNIQWKRGIKVQDLRDSFSLVSWAQGFVGSWSLVGLRYEPLLA